MPTPTRFKPLPQASLPQIRRPWSRLTDGSLASAWLIDAARQEPEGNAAATSVRRSTRHCGAGGSRSLPVRGRNRRGEPPSTNSAPKEVVIS